MLSLIPPADTSLVPGSDHLQSLIDRGDGYHPASAPDVYPRGAAGTFGHIPGLRSRWLGVDAIRLLAALCVLSWSTVAVETWLLVR